VSAEILNRVFRNAQRCRPYFWNLRRYTIATGKLQIRLFQPPHFIAGNIKFLDIRRLFPENCRHTEMEWRKSTICNLSTSCLWVSCYNVPVFVVGWGFIRVPTTETMRANDRAMRLWFAPNTWRYLSVFWLIEWFVDRLIGDWFIWVNNLVNRLLLRRSWTWAQSRGRL